MTTPKDYRFTKDHEWAKRDGDLIVVGITDYAQSQLGDVVFLELPEIGEQFTKGASLAVVESVKAASDIYAPVTGKVVARNEEPVTNPELINKDPYAGAWMVKLAPSDPSEFDKLIASPDYDKLVEELSK